MAQIYDVIIIGGGPGGYSAALYCARAGLDTLVLEMLSAGGQMATTTQIDNYPGFDQGVDGFDLGQKMQAGAARFGAKTAFDQVVRVDLNAAVRKIETASGVYFARAVILATGASPRMLGVPGEEALRGRGISYCATCDGMFFKGKTVAVIGGGNTAAASALTLAKLCQKVYLIHRRDQLRADALEQTQLQSAPNIELVLCASVVRFEGSDQLRAVALQDTRDGHARELAVSGAFIAVGATPNTQLVTGQIALTESGYIDADETTCTSLPGVFAVGDVRQKPLRQIVTAAADGAVASKFVQEYLRQNP